MQRLAILDSPSPSASLARREIGSELGTALHAATSDPARMLPLWTAFSRGEPVRATELRRAVSDRFVAESVRHELLINVDVGDDEPWLRGSLCIVAADVSGELCWVASDYPWYDPDPNAVTGPGEASATLLAAVPQWSYQRVLDVGCGSGAVGVRLATGDVRCLVASDVNPRALALTELTAALNGRDAHTVLSDFADALTGEHDLVVCNPPFILGRPDGRTIFRDSVDGSGHATIGLDLAPLLAVGGLLLYLANWEYQIGEGDPVEHLGIDLTSIDGCDVLVIERAVVPVADYVRVWSTDEAEQQRWIAGFAKRDVTHVGTGIVAVLRSSAPEHTVTVAKEYQTPRDQLGRLVHDWVGTRISQR